MLLDAIKGGSSDIHFEPYEKSYRSLPNRWHFARNLQTQCGIGQQNCRTLKSHVQNGHFRTACPSGRADQNEAVQNKAIDFRVNTLPTLWGEKVVLRILDPSSAKMGIDALGYEEVQKKMYMDALEQPQGMILVTGPTGSGKPFPFTLG